MGLEDQISRFTGRSIATLSLPVGSKILDAPCGLGRHAHWLSSLGHNVFAADIDRDRLSAAASTAPKFGSPIRWIEMDMECPWHRRDRFDLFLMVHYHSDNVVKRAVEILRSGGIFVFETFGGHGKNYLSLPRSGWFESALKTQFNILELKERPVGPQKQRSVVMGIAKKI